MSELFKVNSPPPAQEVNRIRPQGPTQTEVSIQNIPDPTRVTQSPEQSGVNAERDYNRFMPNFESNFDKFVQMLRSTPDGVSLYEELFFTRMGNQVSSGISEGLAAEMNEYMQLLKMSDAELLAFIKDQLQNSVKFEGAIFNIFRDIFDGTTSSELKFAMLEMLRNYDSMTSSQHILDELLSNLRGMADHMPSGAAAELESMIDALMKQHANGQNQSNVSYMKNTILPFLSQYISKNGDFGTVRDLATMFTLNLARYESGTVDNFLQSLHNLMNFEEVAKALPGIDLKELESMFINSNYPDNELLDRFTSILSRGLAGEAGVQSRPVFENILQSMLVNESVYMPLLHAVIPAEVFGSLFYGEMWVDPDDSGSGGESGSEKRGIKILMKFDIKNVGYFEMIMLSREGDVDMQLFYPEHLDNEKGDIRAAISEIMTRNGFSINNFSLDQVTVPKTVSEVFPKIYERKNAINVII